MNEGFFVVVAALVGLIGATLGAILVSRADDRRRRQALVDEDRRRYQALVREVASDFLLPIVRLRQARIQIREGIGDVDELKRQMDANDHIVRYEMDRVRITLESLKVQEAARYVVRYAHGLCLEVKGLEPREDEKGKNVIVLLEKATYAFMRDLRVELGLTPGVFEDPVDMGPGGLEYAAETTKEEEEEEEEEKNPPA